MTSELRVPPHATRAYVQVFHQPALEMTATLRRVLLFITAAMAIGTTGWIMSACSGDRETAQAEGASAPIGLQTSDLFVTVQNKAGTPLINVTVTIMSVTGLPFTRLVSRMENGAKRDISLSEFSGRDGTPFSSRIVRPKRVRVTGEDLTGNKQEAEVPWK
jgi:hypothetical protein